MEKTFLEPYALNLMPFFVNNVSAFRYKTMCGVSQIDQTI